MRLLLTTISVFVLVQIALSQKRVQLEMLKERDGVMFHHSKPFKPLMERQGGSLFFKVLIISRLDLQQFVFLCLPDSKLNKK